MRKSTHRHLSMVIILAGLTAIFITGALARTIVTIKVRPESTIVKSRILLGDIAFIEGQPALVEKLKVVVIGRAPFPQKTRTVRKVEIIARLKQHHVDIQSVDLCCPDRVVIKRDFTTFGLNDLEKITKSFIFENMPWAKEDVEIKNFRGKPVILPKGKVTYSFSPQKKEDYLGFFTAPLTFYAAGGTKKKIWVSADIIVVTAVAVANHQIERHHTVSREDIKVEKKDISRLSSSVITNSEEIIGKRTVRKVSEGTVLKEEMFENTPSVHKGDLITIIAETDTMKITAPGKAEQDGYMGDVIRVCNITSKKDVFARIRNAKEVEVEF